MGWDNMMPSNRYPNWGPPADFILAVNSSDGLSSERYPTWKLEYGLWFGPRTNDTCTAQGMQPKTSGSEYSSSSFFRGEVFFNVSNITGVPSEVAADNECAVPLVALGYLGTNETEPACPILSWPRPKPAICSFKVDAGISQQVSQAMKDMPRCAGVCARAKATSNRAFGDVFLVVLLAAAMTITLF